MDDLQVDLNAAIYAVKQKCVDLDERVHRENEKPENRGRGYLGVRRYIYALTTKPKEKRGRSLTRVYLEQKFYRSKSVPSPEQVERLEDCSQDYGPSGEERLEFTETITSPLSELLKEDKSHSVSVSKRLPQGHAAWDHELIVFEEDGASGRLEDRTLTLRAGDHPSGDNDLTEVAEKVTTNIATFFGSSKKEELTHLTSYGSMARSKSLTTLERSESPRPRLDKINSTTTSLSNLYTIQTTHDHNSRYGAYTSGVGRFGGSPSYGEIRTEHVYDLPVVKPNVVTTTTTHASREDYGTRYQRKYDFKKTFPPQVEMPEGYHNYYDPSKIMFLDSQGYYHGNITRPLHYTYSRDYFEKYSDYGSSRRQTPSPAPPTVVEVVPVVAPVEVPPPVVYEVLPFNRDLHHTEIVFKTHPEYEDAAQRVYLTRTRDLDHEVLHIQRSYPVYEDGSLIKLFHTQDLEQHPIVLVEYPLYKPYEEPEIEVQEVIAEFDSEPEYEEVYEEPTYEEPYEPINILHYTHCIPQTSFEPMVPYNPPPPPPPVVIIPVVAPPVVEPPPVPAERHYDEIYIGQEALDVSVSPTFNRSEDQKNLGLAKSVHDRVREMEATLRGEDAERRAKEEREAKYQQLQREINEARVEDHSYNAYEEVEESKNTPAPQIQPIKVPTVFTPPPPPVVEVVEKPKRTWVPPPKPLEIDVDYDTDKPLGPIVFHELMYQQGVLKQMYELEHHHHQSRPVSRPVSRANSRPSTPSADQRFGFRIDVPRIDQVGTHYDEDISRIDYVHDRIERYNAISDSHHSENESAHHTIHRESVVYDEPAVHYETVYDVPHEEDWHSNLHIEAGNVVAHSNQHIEIGNVVAHSQEDEYATIRHHQEIRQMSKSNRWSEEGSGHSHSANAVLQHSNSLNRQNIPAPLTIQSEVTQSTIHHANSFQDLSPDHKSLSNYSVGNVKNLAKLFNKHDEKPISTEQVIYRTRSVPPSQIQEVKPRPRSLRRIPLDEVELHEHGEDHMTKTHQHHEAEEHHHVEHHVHYPPVEETSNVVHHHHHHHHVDHHSAPIQKTTTRFGYDDEPELRVRRVYVPVDNTSMLSPISQPDEDQVFQLN